ncbi:hypothetical protein HWV07_14030 [Natronomonas salina]|uniref:hypothetical protein n=1 Tax=Natronomonas salina TaxID=1710540 RepID=UPI0015B4984D|nr:hypothetical protein [Natronomonas salina]QLD90089.1 hypothetical protein HWV07_14030 [Natronomonas salina]
MSSDQIDVSGYDYEATENDQVRVNATVENEADDNQRVSLTMSVGDGDDRREKSTDLKVRANESTEAEPLFDVDVEAFRDDGNVDFEWDAQPE